MRKLFAFLIRYSETFLFVLLQVFSFYLIINYSSYQKSVFLSSGNSFIAYCYNLSNSATEFVNLGTTNSRLAEENNRLQNELVLLKNELSIYQESFVRPETGITADLDLEYIDAKVINASTNKMLNYLTVNKGSRQGIEPDMGVINSQGVVGIVDKVSTNFSTIIPIINGKLQVNGKFLHSNYTGPLVWPGNDSRYARLNDIARHVEFSLGDTLVTSGFTQAFPEGILIGTIDDYNIKESDPYFNIRVKLAVDFRTISFVRIIHMKQYKEKYELENSTVIH